MLDAKTTTKSCNFAKIYANFHTYFQKYDTQPINRREYIKKIKNEIFFDFTYGNSFIFVLCCKEADKHI